MATRTGQPDEAALRQAETAWIESDAATNDEAIREIDDHAARFGLIRTGEYWLPVAMWDGRYVRRAICDRPVQADVDEKMERVQAGRTHHGGQSSAEIILEDRRA